MRDVAREPALDARDDLGGVGARNRRERREDVAPVVGIDRRLVEELEEIGDDRAVVERTERLDRTRGVAVLERRDQRGLDVGLERLPQDAQQRRDVVPTGIAVRQLCPQERTHDRGVGEVLSARLAESVRDARPRRAQDAGLVDGCVGAGHRGRSERPGPALRRIGRGIRSGPARRDRRRDRLGPGQPPQRDEEAGPEEQDRAGGEQQPLFDAVHAGATPRDGGRRTAPIEKCYP